MKLNLPSTLTSQKMSTLFLLTSLNVFPVKGGNNFRECLQNASQPYNSTDLYESIIKTSSLTTDNNSTKNSENFCCGLDSVRYNYYRCGSNSIISGQCLLPPSGILDDTIWVYCRKIGQSVTCFTSAPHIHATYLCGGILGDFSPINANMNTTINACPETRLMYTALSNPKQITNNKISFLCCNTDNCSILKNVGMNQNNIITNCVSGQHSLMCFSDNNGWVCRGTTSGSIPGGSNGIGTCISQISSSNSSSSNGSISSSNSSFASPDKTKTIAIGVGTGTGVLVIGATSYMVWKKKCSAHQQKEENIEIGMFDLDNKEAKDKDKKKRKKKKIKNILIIGADGSGKSTLANVLTGTDKFGEGKYSSKKTPSTQEEKFEHKGVKYKVIDFVGINDKSSKKEISKIITDTTLPLKNKLTQILFVFDGKFEEQENLIYNLLVETLGKDTPKKISIIRTKFPAFEDQKECQQDKVINENKNLTKIIEECNGIIHVNNPSLDNQKREASRVKVLEYLVNNQNIPENLFEGVKKATQLKNNLEEIQAHIEVIV